MSRKPKNDKAAQQIGEQIRIGRAVKNMTQAELGNITGISQKMVSIYERGLSVPPASDFCVMITTLELDCKIIVCSISGICTNDVR